jgi:hypothetical protein
VTEMDPQDFDLLRRMGYEGGSGVTIETKPSGRTVYTFSQSGIKRMLRCPEQFRLVERVGVRDPTGDAAAMGTAFHIYCEERLCGVPLPAALALAARALNLAHEHGQFQFVQVKTIHTLQEQLGRVCQRFEDETLPMLPLGGDVEVSKKMLVAETTTYDIYLKGTPDYVYDGVVYDFKTATDVERQYPQWEVDRFHVQPTVYCALTGAADFCYLVHEKGDNGIAKQVWTERGPIDFGWLGYQLQSMLPTLHTPGVWPMNDQGWHCSPKWCPAWSVCKGSYMA